MSYGSAMKSLAERRRLLVAQSEEYRQEIVAEMENIAAATAWIERGYSTLRSFRSVWPLVAAVAGAFMARKGGFILRNAGKAWSLWQLARKLLRTWQRRPADSTPQDEPLSAWLR